MLSFNFRPSSHFINSHMVTWSKLTSLVNCHASADELAEHGSHTDGRHGILETAAAFCTTSVPCIFLRTREFEGPGDYNTLVLC